MTQPAFRTKTAIASKRTSVSRSVWVMIGMLTLTAAAALQALNAHAQTPAAASAAAAPPAPVTAPAAAQAASPKYAAQDVERVFNYLDSNHDGKISREEGAAFKNIASHFDGADTNKDNMLSREEFENAVNGSKPQ